MSLVTKFLVANDIYIFNFENEVAWFSERWLGSVIGSRSCLKNDKKLTKLAKNNY